MRRIPGLAGARERPRVSTLKCVKPSKSDPYACFVLSRASSNIRSIETRHETSNELSRSPENGSITSHVHPTGRRESTPPRGVKPSISVPYIHVR